MATQHPNALTRALAELPGPLPAFGVIHIAIPHTSRFTVVGNHLAQHAELSLVAIGIGVHIQSLPVGSLVGIKALTARFAEGEMRIAAALRELEAHGYLRRPLPQPRELTPELRRTASAILADMRSHAKELVLSEDDIEELIPGVAAWLEREVRPDAIRHALTADLPKPPKYPAKIVRHRLTVLLPPPLPGAEELAPAVRRPLVIPLQNCDVCDRAFRSREPGHCRGCRDLAAAA